VIAGESLKFKLSEIAEIHAGIYRKPDLYGDIIYLQVKHFDNKGNIISDKISSKDLKLNKRLKKHLLQNDDIIFAAKGDKNFAFLYHHKLGPAVASSSFLVIRIMDSQKKRIKPEYLHWFLNHPFTQALIKMQAKGSALPVISKAVMENFEIPIPSLKIQMQIKKINELWKSEKSLMQKIISQKEKMYQMILYKQANGEQING